MVWSIRNVVYYLLNLWLAVVTFFLGFRIVFQLFAANSGTPFVAWIYDVSAAIMSPFAGIFPSLQLAGRSNLDTVAISSLFAYAMVNWVILAIVDSATAATEETVHSTTHRHV